MVVAHHAGFWATTITKIQGSAVVYGSFNTAPQPARATASPATQTAW